MFAIFLHFRSYAHLSIILNEIPRRIQTSNKYAKYKQNADFIIIKRN